MGAFAVLPTVGASEFFVVSSARRIALSPSTPLSLPPPLWPICPCRHPGHSSRRTAACLLFRPEWCICSTASQIRTVRGWRQPGNRIDTFAIAASLDSTPFLPSDLMAQEDQLSLISTSLFSVTSTLLASGYRSHRCQRWPQWLGLCQPAGPDSGTRSATLTPTSTAGRRVNGTPGPLALHARWTILDREQSIHFRKQSAHRLAGYLYRDRSGGGIQQSQRCRSSGRIPSSRCPAKGFIRLESCH